MKKVKKEDGVYKFYELEIGYPEGFSFLGFNKILGWREEGSKKWNRGEYDCDEKELYPIRIIVSVIGFTDFRASSRNWGVE